MKMKSEFHRQFCGDGRSYLLGSNIYTRYVDTAKIKKLIKENVLEYILIDSAVRITIDSHDSEPERLVISVPLLADATGIIDNFVELIFTNITSYYSVGNPKINHYGISNTILEGFNSAALRRELELICQNIASRADIAGRAISKVRFEETKFVANKKFAFSSILQKRLDLHLGYRVTLYGERINSQSFFIPVTNDNGILQQIYNNIEIILQHNFVAYDDTADHGYLRLSNNLIMKEMHALLKRAKNKENVRKKIVHNIKYSTTLTNDSVKRYGELSGDYIYDTINQIDTEDLIVASDRSKALYDTFNFRIADSTANQTIDGFDDIIVSKNDTYIPPVAGAEDINNMSQSVEQQTMGEELENQDIAIEDDLSLDDDSYFEEI